MKETIPSSSITWSEMGKQNVQPEKVYCYVIGIFLKLLVFQTGFSSLLYMSAAIFFVIETKTNSFSFCSCSDIAMRRLTL